MKLIVSTFAALAVFAAVGQAAPLETKNVAANAKWVVHVDVDAVRDSLIVKKAFETCPLLKDSGKHFDMIRDKAGVDLRKDLHGITLYGPDTDKTHAVAIVFSTVNQKLLLEKAQKATDHKVTKHGKIDIHSWTQKHGTKTQTAAGAFYKPDVLVFAANAEGVAAAIDVLGRQVARPDRCEVAAGGPSAGGRDRRGPGDRHSGRRRDAPFSSRPSRSASPWARYNGKSFYRASLVMKSPEAANQVKAITDGFKAIGVLAVRQGADVMKLVDGLKARSTTTPCGSAGRPRPTIVWTVVEKVAKKAAEHMKKGGKCPFLPGGRRPRRPRSRRPTTAPEEPSVESFQRQVKPIRGAAGQLPPRFVGGRLFRFPAPLHGIVLSARRKWYAYWRRFKISL